MLWKLPLIDACLNGLSFALQMTGLIFILKRRIALHKIMMLSAVTVSALFLCGYLTFHYNAGSIRFGGAGVVRTIYFTILLTHTVLAASLVVLVPVTVTLGLRGSLRHKKWARITLPIWSYVSVTGVVIFLMLLPYYPISPLFWE